MRDSVALKRLELLVSMTDKPQKPGKKSTKKIKPSGELPSDDFAGTPPSVSKIKLKVGANGEPQVLNMYDEMIQSNGPPRPFEIPQSANQSPSNSDGDTDDMLEAASSRIGKAKTKKRSSAVMNMPAPPLYRDDEQLIAMELERFKSSYMYTGQVPSPSLPGFHQMLMPMNPELDHHYSMAAQVHPESMPPDHGYMPMPYHLPPFNPPSDIGHKRVLSDPNLPIKKVKPDDEGHY